MDLEGVDVEGILSYYSIKNISKDGDEVHFSCPFPEHVNGDRNPSSGINEKSGRYNCFSCHRKGTVITFVAEMESIDEGLAARWIREGQFYKGTVKGGSIVETLRKKLQAPKPPPRTATISEHAVSSFRVDWQKVYDAWESGDAPHELTYIMEAKGFTPQTLSKFGLGFDTHSNRLTIPIRNSEGKLVGFKARAVSSGQMPKYKVLGDKEGDIPHYGFPTSKVHEYVYGLDTASEDVIICEGEFDSISLRQKGFDGSVALGTAKISETQVRELRKKAKRATILFDNDSAGRAGALQVFSDIIKYMPTFIGVCPEGRDPAEMTQEEIQTAIKQAKNPRQEKRKQGAKTNG